MVQGDGPTGKPPKQGDEVWMSCRANANCEGTKAVIVFMQKHPLQHGGGTSIRYRCQTCNGAFHITR